MDVIESKRDELANQDASAFAKTLKNYLLSVVYMILVVAVYFTFGSGTLFLCKIAQSNLLPDDVRCAPYNGSDEMAVDAVPINLLVTDSEPPLSQKLLFSPETNKPRLFFKDPQLQDSYLAAFFAAIFVPMLTMCYGTVNSVFDKLNQLPEWCAITFGPLIWLLVLLVLVILSIFYFPFLWFSNLGWLFKEKKDNGWQAVGLFSSVWRWCLVIAFAFIGFSTFGIGPLFGLFAAITALSSFLYFQGIMLAVVDDDNPNEETQPISFFSFLPESFRHFKLLFMGILSMMVVRSTFDHLGVKAGLFSIAVLILIYFGVIQNDMFQKVEEHKEMGRFGPLSSYAQAVRQCTQATSGGGSSRYSMFGGQRQLMKDLKLLNRYLR